MSSFRTGRLEITIDGAHAVLSGRMDDTCQLGEVARLLPPGDVVINTAGVTFVNSIGTREWARLIRVLRGRGMVTLEAVSDVLLTQMNQLSEFHGNVRITSFHVFYVCPACGYETSALVDTTAHIEALSRLQAPSMPCPECNAGMELGDFAERYLSIFSK